MKLLFVCESSGIYCEFVLGLYRLRCLASEETPGECLKTVLAKLSRERRFAFSSKVSKDVSNLYFSLEGAVQKLKK